MLGDIAFRVSPLIWVEKFVFFFFSWRRFTLLILRESGRYEWRRQQKATPFAKKLESEGKEVELLDLTSFIPYGRRIASHHWIRPKYSCVDMVKSNVGRGGIGTWEV
jgi:hypothetical protein